MKRNGARYLALADKIAADVAKGRLSPGERLPTQRAVAEQLGIDLTTVTRGYSEAERRGLIVGQVGRGTFVRPSSSLSRAGVGVRQVHEVLDLSQNIPPSSNGGPERLSATLREMSERPHVAELLRYHSNSGAERHRRSAAAWIQERGVDANADRVVVCSGAQHALAALLMTHASPGSRVMTEATTYPGFRGIAELLHLEVIPIDLDDDGIDPRALRREMRRTGARLLYCTPSAHNPTAITSSVARRRDIARIGNEDGLTILEDDIYSPIVLGPPPIARFAPSRTFLISSLSKAVAPGLRIGYVLCPTTQQAERVAAGVRATTMMATPLMADIATTWLDDGTARELIEFNRAEAGKRQHVAERLLGRLGWNGAKNSYHGWLKLPANWRSQDFVDVCRANGVLVAPADAFAASGNSVPPAIRISTSAAASMAALERALTVIVNILQYGPRGNTPVI